MDEDPDAPTNELVPHVPSPPGKLPKAISGSAKRINQDPKLIETVKRLRRMLPGDERFGDPLSTTGSDGSQAAARALSQIAKEHPGVLHEAGMSALQVWQAFSESRGRGRGTVDLAIVFTDLVGFSSFALEAGDAATLELLRAVGDALEPAVLAQRGEVVKWLGDGMMAVFREADEAIAAVLAGQAGLEQIEYAGYRPRIRAGVHVGRPRKLGGDYLGIDVNIAARIAQAAGPGELLISDRTLEDLDPEAFETKRKRMFRAKGVPSDVSVFSVRPR